MGLLALKKKAGRPLASPKPCARTQRSLPEGVRDKAKDRLRELTLEAIRAEVATWSPEKREAFEERAAIVEHEGKETRLEAEQLAFALHRDKVE